MNTTQDLVNALQVGAHPSSPRYRLGVAIAGMPPDRAAACVLRGAPPPPVAAHTMDVARYELRISENQRVLLLTALAQGSIVAKHCGDDPQEFDLLREMLDSTLEEIPTCNDFTL